MDRDTSLKHAYFLKIKSSLLLQVPAIFLECNLGPLPYKKKQRLLVTKPATLGKLHAKYTD